MLSKYLEDRGAQRELLLMTHIVIGYPDLETSYQTIRTMVEAGVELIEMQIPFSEPIADGPVILHANQEALATGITVDECFAFARRVTAEFDIPFLFMSYYNILFRRGVEKFVADMVAAGVKGAIVPDLPPEEADALLSVMRANDVDPIFIYTPQTEHERLRYIDEHASGFIYCVARKGVTGLATDFATELETYLAACRDSTKLPLALGFGVRTAEDVAYLRGKVDVAIVGTEAIRVLQSDGVAAVGDFMRSLRPWLSEQG